MAFKIRKELSFATQYVTLDKLDNFTKPQFCYLQNGENNTSVIGLWYY